MSKNTYKASTNRYGATSASTVIGISLVLFTMGLLGLLLLNAKKLSNYVKENVQLEVYMAEACTQEQLDQLKNGAQTLPYVKQVLFISKAEAAEKLKQELGEDFIGFLGYNPLSHSFSISVKADYADPEMLQKLSELFSTYQGVEEVRYSRDLVSQINANTRTVAIILLGFSALLLLVSIALINNTIRLAIFAQRFIIKTMQLVGAKASFIRRPFLLKGTLNGLIAALIASALLASVIYAGQQQFPELFELQDMLMYAQIFGGIVALGIVIAWVSTLLAVRKYIRLKTDEVY